MPVEYCKRCKSARPMQIATSRIRVLLRGGRTDEITTRTYYCPHCRSFTLGDGKDRQELHARPHNPVPAVDSHRRISKDAGLVRSRT